MLQVVLDGVLRNVEIRCNDLIRAAICHSTEDFELSCRDQVIGSMFGHYLGNFVGNTFPPALNQTNRFHEFGA
jgi:hypothetical protein